MSRLLYMLRTIMTMGREPQTFIDARWIRLLLQICPRSMQRDLALRVLNLSPHYFNRSIDPAYQKTPFPRYLELEHERNQGSRRKIREQILAPYLRDRYTVLDYGCGPGYLAKEVSGQVRQVYACDISRGVLKCAEIINGAENIEYIYADETDLEKIPDGSVDLVYSFAVIQHVTDDAFNKILTAVEKKLKEEGQAVFHVHLDTNDWRSEQAYRDDTSLAGRMRFRYGLNCFSRTADSVDLMFSRHGFTDVTIRNVEDMVAEIFDDVCTQSLVTATKGRRDTDDRSTDRTPARSADALAVAG